MYMYVPTSIAQEGGMIFILRHGGKIKALFVYILYDVSYSSNTIRHHYLRNTEDMSLA